MAKIRVTIYIDEEVWGGVKESAWKRRESASSYLEKLIRSGSKSFTDAPKFGGVLEPTELKKWESEEFVKVHMSTADNPGGDAVQIITFVEDDGIAMLAKKQAEINSIKAKKIAKVKDNIRPDDEVKADIRNQLGQARRSYPKKSWAKK